VRAAVKVSYETLAAHLPPGIPVIDVRVGLGRAETPHVRAQSLIGYVNYSKKLEA
jgi:hypothetical protein